MADNIRQAIELLANIGYLRTHRITGDYYQVTCPFHSDGNEKKPSCGILLVDRVRGGNRYKAGWFHCFACGYAGDFVPSIDKLFELKHAPERGADWLSRNVPGFDADAAEVSLVSPELLDSISAKFAVRYIQEVTHGKQTYISEAELASYRYTVPYMYERKLTDEIIAKYDIGVDMNWVPPGRKKPVPCITIPVNDASGNTLFFCRRSIEGKLYNYPEGVLKPVFGIDKLPTGVSSVVICESCINALTAVVYGYPAVALMGTGNSYQVQQLKELGVSEFVICCDGDFAGRRAAAQLKRALSSTAIVWTIDMPDGKDLNDLDKETFIQLYNERS